MTATLIAAVAGWLLRRWAFIALAAACGPALAAELSVMPVSMALDAQRDRSLVQVRNHGKTPVLLQAEAIGWRREGGVDHDIATSDLIVNPPLFTVAPGREQVVRIGLRRGSVAAEKEGTYRLVLREVPTTAAADPDVQGQVRVLVALRLPVYVAPARPRHQVQWQTTIDEHGRVTAEAVNTGNVHVKLAALRLAAGPGLRPGADVLPQGPQSVMFPGESRRFQLQPPAGNAGVTTLEVVTDRGVEHVALAPRR